MRVPVLITASAAFALVLAACERGPSQADIMAGNVPVEDDAAPATTPSATPSASDPAIPVTYGLSVVITGYGDRKISVIQAVRDARPDLGLAEAKALVEGAPATVKSGLSAADATALQHSLEAAGATVSVQ